MRFILGVVGVSVGLFCLVEVLAYVTWSLSNMGDRAFQEALQREVVDRERDVIGHHRVLEWNDRLRDFHEAPELAERVEAGTLEPVEQRLPKDPLVIDPPQQRGPYGGDWMRYAVGVGDVNSVFFGGRLTYDGLVRWCPMGEKILPNLARDWEVKESGRIYIIYLREGVRWSDGEPFTADDIVFWYEHVLLNEEITSTINREWKAGGEVMDLTKVDDYTIRIAFAEPRSLFIERTLGSRFFDAMLVPRHYMKQFHADFARPEPGEELKEGELPRWFRREMEERNYHRWPQLYSYMDRWQNPDKPTLKAWKLHRPPPSRPVVFVRNPYYWKVDPDGRQLPYIDRVSFHIFELEIIAMRAIQGLMPMQKRHIRFDRYALLMENQGVGNYEVRQWIAGSGNDLAIAPNLNHQDPATRELMRDPRFRKALSLALDREMINQARYYGQAQPRQVAASERSPFYDPEYESAYIEYDPERAIELLAEIGLERRRDGRWLGKDGRPLRFQIDVTNTPSGGDVLVDLVADAWTALGVRADVNRLARPLFTQRRAGRLHDFHVWEGEWEDNPIIQPRWHMPYYPGASPFAEEYALWFHTDGESGTEPSGDIRRVIERYREIEQELDRQKQIEMFAEISRLNRENLWVIGVLGKAPTPVVVHNHMRNVPDVALSTWEVRSPANTATEVYVWEGGN